MHLRLQNIRLLSLHAGVVLSMSIAGCAELEEATPEDATLTTEQGPSPASGKGDIYGEDSRQDYYTLRDPILRAAADKVALILHTRHVEATGDGDENGAFRVVGPSLGERYELCEEVPFREQLAPGGCTGFLVGPDLIATAGHCVQSDTRCQDLRLIFDYRQEGAGDDPSRVRSDEIYQCTEVVARARGHQAGFDVPDYAILKLDRAVTTGDGITPRESFKLSDQTIVEGQAVASLGHPSGMPLKIVSDGTVWSWDEVVASDMARASAAWKNFIESGELFEKHKTLYFPSTLDTFVGNSGGPVIDPATGHLVGITAHKVSDPRIGGLFSLDEAYITDKTRQCQYPTVCGEEIVCAGSFATRVSAFRDSITQ